MVRVDHSIGIVAHVDRVDMVSDLVDATSPKVVNVDNGTLGCPGNHGYVQARLAGEDGWSVVLEDDAVLLNEFHDDLNTVLDIASTKLDPSVKVVGLYLGTGYPAQWQKRMVEAVESGTSFIVCKRLLHAVGYCIAPDIKCELAHWMTTKKRGPGMAPDDAISVWANAHKVQVAYTNPQLVDHRDQPTVIVARSNNFAPGRNRPRRAHNTRMRENWDDSVVVMQ